MSSTTRPPRRSRRLFWLVTAGAVIVLAIVAAFAVPRIYASVVADDADAAPTVTVDPEGTSSTALDDLSGEWSVQSGSYAGYRVDEVLNGADVTVTGRTEEVSGDLVIDGLTLSEATVTVDVASIATDNGNRDDYFRNDALETDQFPTATFVLTEPLEATSTPTPGEPQTVDVTGELTLHGVTNTVTAELEAVLNGEGGQVAGSIPITFEDFGVTAPNLGFVSVEPTGFVEFLLEVAPSA